jgi:hypothetical protein
MADKHLLYFTAQQVTVFRWKSGELTLEKVLPASEEGAAAFGEFVSIRTDSLFYILADIVEEDFSQENIPAVRGADRRLLLQRKLAQRYRDTSLALALSLGFERVGSRREEQILFSSFTNTQQFQPWLEVLRAQSARLVGIYSMPLVAPIVGKRIGLKSTNYLLVSLEGAGLRQTYVQNGQVRFSRLGSADRSDPRALAETCAAESGRIQQYLVNLRIIPRSAAALDVIVIVPQEHKALYEAACQSTAALDFRVLDIDEPARTAGLKKVPEETESEALFLHVLAGAQPTDQFASDDLRRFYHLWRAKIALLVAGAAAFAFCLVLSGLKFVDFISINRAAANDVALEAVSAQQYARMQATFPETPTSSEKLKAIVENYNLIMAQPSSPEPTLIQISRALTMAPQIELERIDWDANTTGRKPAADKAAAAPAKAGSAPRPAGVERETVQLSGRITSGQGNDYRAITLIVDRFAEALRAQPGIEVVSRRLPFDINAEKSLSGDIGAERTAEVPRFTLILSKRAAQ